jgi:hypothetical protein
MLLIFSMEVPQPNKRWEHEYRGKECERYAEGRHFPEL